MNRATTGRNAIDAFFDNFSCAALFGKLHIPGAPREIVDLRTLKEFQRETSQEIAEKIQRRHSAYFAAEAKKRAKSSRRASFHPFHAYVGSMTQDESAQKLMDGLSQPPLKPLDNQQESR
jgi:hypothetical protein